MATATSLCLLMLLLTPWMANGRPTEEPVQPHSRNSRQMLLPFGPIYQPSFKNYGDPMGAMTPATKRQFLQALLVTSSVLSSQSLDNFDFKTALNQKNGEMSVDSNPIKQEFDTGTMSAMDLQNMGFSPELFKEIEGRISLQNLVSIILQSMSDAILRIVLQQIIG